MLVVKVFRIQIEADEGYDEDWFEIKNIEMLSIASGSR